MWHRDATWEAAKLPALRRPIPRLPPHRQDRIPCNHRRQHTGSTGRQSGNPGQVRCLFVTSPSRLAVTLPAELLGAYQDTAYRVYDRNNVEILRIREASDFMVARMRQLEVTTACLITAWNPHSEPTGETENRARNSALESEIRKTGLFLLPGRGEDPQDGWPGEESFLVFGPTRGLTIRWCRQYRQNAVVWVGNDGVPLLLLQDGTLLDAGD